MMMTNNSAEIKTEEIKKERNWKKTSLDVFMILLVIAITICLFLFRARVSDLGNFGYLGAFLISLVANATIILPMPGLLILIGLGASFNPILVAVCGGIGGSLGEMTGYILGRSGRRITSNNKWYTRAENWMKKRGFLAVFCFALLPFLPLDVAGLIAGVLRYPVWKFLLACTLGKTLLYVIMIQTGAWGWDAFLELIT
ncbi:MAG TPA: VTT domain-containing protein [Dehalococcoidia bacterium]|nr:VTT domain-containing protein [Dehalococcoidia bacterium]